MRFPFRSGMTKIEKEVAKALDVSIASLINSEHETLVRSNSEDEYVHHMNRSENGGEQASLAKCQKIMQPESLPQVYDGKAKCMQGTHTAQLQGVSY